MSNLNLIDFHHELSQQDFYLGRPAIAQTLVWKKVGYTTFITSSKAAAEYDAALAEYNAAVEYAASAAVSRGIGPMEKPQIEVAELILVAKTSPLDCWLMPWLWTAPTEYTKTLAKMKLSCRLIAPPQAPFNQDFAVVLENVKSLMDASATKGYRKQGIFNSKGGGHGSIQVQHTVFELKQEGEKDDDNAFKLGDWPVNPNSPAALAAHKEMVAKNSHHVHRLPAYDVDGKLIAPADCAQLLAGAVVRATISIKHWSIRSKTCDTYAADIERFRVIIPAPVHGQAGPSSPRKRKALPAMDDGLSPSKKAHI
ncbi:hypothetical protein MSAN_01390400 [Mycena sanguinolenta]|uniref:Uncharacterized protein n=1 Tax=Mycena sanguinolenta TaxID=230812 RepID=A0A8H7D0B9_9AGAR|nr:hypothetical protein MSAN_01390400 [Mycena sanguinolenta]